MSDGPRDAINPGPLGPDGEPTFPDADRLADGSIDWAKLGAVPAQYSVVDREGRRHHVDARPSVPHPADGRPVRPK